MVAVTHYLPEQQYIIPEQQALLRNNGIESVVRNAGIMGTLLVEPEHETAALELLHPDGNG